MQVLRCFPFRRFDVRAVLIETNKARHRRAQPSASAAGANPPLSSPPPQVSDFRGLVRFFHRHGYACVESFADAPTRRPGRPGGRAEIIDHLFVYQATR